MVRSLTAVIVACLFAAGSIWLIRTEGQAYRAELHRRKLAAAETEQPQVSATERPEKLPTVKPTPGPAKPDHDVSTAKPSPAVGAPPEEKRASAAQPAPGGNNLANEKPAHRSTPMTAAAEKSLAARAATNPFANSAFWSQAQMAHQWELSPLKLDDELRLGAQLHDLILQLNPQFAGSGPWKQRLDEAAEPFRQYLKRKDIIYTFTILDSDVVNAFSHPGGYIYVTRGFFDFVGAEEDYVLQFAIGHEIAHVELEHAVECLRNKSLMDLKLGTLQALYLVIIPFGYLIDEKANVDQELEADRWVFECMRRLRRTPRETLMFLQKLEGYSKKHGFPDGRAKPETAKGSSPLDNHYKSQTAAWKRLKRLKELVAKDGERKK
jgi:Peptidase family M48